MSPLVAGVLIAGVVGAITVHAPTRGALPGAVPTNPTSTRPLPGAAAAGATTVPTVAATPPGPASAAPTAAVLSDDLLAFADLGGFYRPLPSQSPRQLAGSSCLAPLAPAGATASAQTYFAGPSAGSLPAINEVLAAYDGAAVSAAYQRDVAALEHCAPLTLPIGGAAASVSLRPDSTVMPIGDADTALSGTTAVGSRKEMVSIAVVQRAQVVIVIVYADSVPASNALYGDFPSTVAAAVGKLA